MKIIKAGLIQQKCGQSSDQNLQNSIQAIRNAAAQGAGLVVLQELHQTIYFCHNENSRYFDLAESIPGPTTSILGKLASELELVIVCSIFEKRAVGIYHNTAVVLDSDGSIAGKYRKMHIPDDPGFYEKFYFTPGDSGFKPIQTSIGKLGVLICWDQWFPEAARLMALAGAEILIYPTAIGWDPDESKEENSKQLDAWITVQRGHAIANGLPLICVNRTGFEPGAANDGDHGTHFWGNSFACGPMGEMLYSTDADEESEQVIEIDLELSENTRRTWPFMRDRRVDYYNDLSRIFIDDDTDNK